MVRWPLKEGFFGSWRESAPGSSAWDCANTLLSEHAKPRSSCFDVDSCFSGVSTPGVVSSAIQMVRPVEQDNFKGKVQPKLMVFGARLSCFWCDPMAASGHQADVSIWTGPAWSCQRATPKSPSGQALCRPERFTLGNYIWFNELDLIQWTGCLSRVGEVWPQYVGAQTTL